jgi:hypothetical protein
MKTIIEIATSLLTAATRLAAKRGTTLRDVVEDGLRRVPEEDARSEDFRLRDRSFKGRGLQPEFRDAGWEKIRGMVYEGRGG